MVSNIAVIDKTTFVRLDFTLWSGRAKLTRDDIPDADKLPPEELASLGSKRLFDPAKLRPFGALKARAHALMERNGIKFCGGYAISIDRAETVREQLADIYLEFEQVKQNFCAEYATGCQEWMDAHPDWADILRNAMPSAHEMPNRFHFSYQMFQVQPTAVLGGSGNDSYTTVLDMGDKALQEICMMARDIYKDTFERGVDLKAKSFMPIKRLLSKIQAVSFTHPHIDEVGTLVRHALEQVELSRYSKSTVDIFKGVLVALTNPVTIGTLMNDLASEDGGPMGDKLYEALWQEPAAPVVENRAVTLDGPTTVVEVNPIEELVVCEKPKTAPSLDLLGVYGDMF